MSSRFDIFYREDRSGYLLREDGSLLLRESTAEVRDSFGTASGPYRAARGKGPPDLHSIVDRVVRRVAGKNYAK